MKRFEKTRSSPGVTAAIWLSVATVFVVDVVTPLGVSIWILYLVPLLLCLYEWRPRFPLVVAAWAALLLVIAYFLSPHTPGYPVAMARVNHSFGLLMIWGVAAGARKFILAKISLREQEWLRAGQRELSERIQGNQTPAELGESILRFLCGHLEAPVGALYVAESEKTFRRRATFAAGSASTPREVVTPGDDLVGQAIAEKRIVRLDDLPADYLPVASTLGRTRPAHLVIVPAQFEGRVMGAIELGFLHPIGKSDMDVLETTSEPIAVALRSAEYRARQTELLERTQRLAAELQAQQEELRVTNEELEEQSRALKESQTRLEAQQAELEQTNSQLEGQTQELERQRDDLSRAQSELVERAEELARANQYKSEFLANMSHELRTPLNSALILAKLLMDNRDGNLTPEQVTYAATIYTSGNDLLVLINDILDLSRIEAGRMELTVEPLETARLAESLRRTFQPMAAEKGLAFAVDVAPETPAAITTDGVRIQQVLRNLLANALKFTGAGSVSVRISPAPGDRISFTVSDTGIGIAADQQEVIFEAFRQADGTTNRLYGGTGLGLTISRELARRLGGDLVVKSAPGEGSSFTLTIPRALEAAPPAPARRPAVPPAAVVRRPAPEPATQPLPVPAIEDDRGAIEPGARTILVVEDDLPFARILRDLARERRFQALVAVTAAEALLLAERFVPSALLLDVQLPDGSGLSVLERLKRNPATRHVPVHVLSVSDHARQALELGAVGYAPKPVARERLLETIGALEQRLAQKVRQVLVVEDASAQRESIVALLKTESVSVVPVATAAEALQRLEETTFDCMVLDLKLPDMTGFELLDRMAAEEAFSFPPVIVYTGRDLTRDEEERLRRYASSIIIKGAKSPERLLDEVTLFLHQVEGTLPAEQQRMLREVRNREAALEGKLILVVDDDARNVFALASVLESQGAHVRVARNGKEALSALESADAPGGARIHLVLMDVMMPEMDGLTAMRRIRKRPEWRKLPIVALTAKAMPKDREECIGAGADDYIAKPLDVDKLLSLVKVWIPK